MTQHQLVGIGVALLIVGLTIVGKLYSRQGSPEPLVIAEQRRQRQSSSNIALLVILGILIALAVAGFFAPTG